MIDLTGTGVALVTPFDQNQKIDFESLDRLLNHTTPHVQHLTALGTTGENPTLSFEDQIKILDHILQKVSLPVIFGLSGNSTMAMKSQVKKACSLDIDALLITSPYYSRPSQDGILMHYEKLADWSTKPIILYNVPARTASNLEPNTTIKLSHHPNVIGIKEASGNLIQCKEIIKRMSKDFKLISGDDATTNAILHLGGSGVISVLANLLPIEMSKMVQLALAGNPESNQINGKLIPYFELMAREGNPTSVKGALEVMGICERHVRLPLTSASETFLQAFREKIAQKKRGEITP